MAGNLMTLLSFAFLVLCQFQNSNAYPTGAVTSACSDMTPNHGFSSQTSVSPYNISVSPAFYQPGQQMTVTISRNANTPALKGILLQARRTGNDQIIGTWSVAGTTDFKTLACSGADSAVTHTNSNDKPATFQLNWTPPDVNGDDIYVTATFVQTRPVFWVAERTSNIQLMTPCDSDPCFNGGTCTNSTDDTIYTCSCPPPFEGPTCQTEIDPCANNSCENGATCVPVPNSLNYTCDCVIGFSGERCETGINPCDINGCQNGATCNAVVGSNTNYTCECPTGFIGEFCEMVQNLCDGNQCQNGAGCTPAPGLNPSYTCQCQMGFSGVLCHIVTITSPCSSNPCQNGGGCTLRGEHWYSCICPTSHIGTNCDIPVTTPCNSSPCQNGGACSVVGSSYSCNCIATYTGTNCQTPVTTTCNPSPCQNGGACTVTGVATYSCACSQSYTGNNCQTSVTTPCNSSPCQNGGACSVVGSFYFCNCPTTHTGTNCQTPVTTTCNPSPCQNGGACAVTGVASYSCACPQAYTGNNCQTSAETTNPTITGCPDTIIQTAARGQTTLSVTWTAPQATDDSGIQSFTSNIPSGFDFPIGQTMTVVYTAWDNAGNINTCAFTVTVNAAPEDPCRSTPCQSGVQCIAAEDFSSFTCQCVSPYTGTTCNQAVSPCVENSCENGATCNGVPGEVAYTCTCPADYTGTLCETSLACTPASVPGMPGDGQKVTHNIFIVATAICVFLINIITM